jgi:hypothetical protein
MECKVSRISGQTSYRTDNDLFSSTSKRRVEEWEAYGISDKYFFHGNYGLAISFSLAGNCPLVFEYLKDRTLIGTAIRELEKHMKSGGRDWCPLKIRRAKNELEKRMLKEMGYDEEKEENNF